MTLPQAITQIKGARMWDLANLVASFILIIPALVMVLTAALGISLLAGWRNYWAKDVAKLIFDLQVWSMVEVFLSGSWLVCLKLRTWRRRVSVLRFGAMRHLPYSLP